MTYKSVVCSNCGWLHFEVDTQHIRDWEVKWAEYWPTLDEEGKEAFGLPDGPPSYKSYLRCFFCAGSHKNFEDASDAVIERLMGSTTQPILRRDEDYE